MPFETTVYEVSWGAAGLAFALGGASSLSHACSRRNRTTGVFLRTAPLLAVLLAFMGARAHAMLSAPLTAWEALWEGRIWDLALLARQRIAGGLLLAMVFFFAVVPRASGFRLRGLEVLDAITPWAGASIGIGRIGCFLAGCCFGVPTQAPWAVNYPAGSSAYWNHIAQGRIVDGAEASLPVHPLSIYLGLAGVASASVALLVRRRRPPEGVVFASFVGCMAATRLWLEPLRETRFLDAVPAQTCIDVLLLIGALGGARWSMRNAPRTPDEPRSSARTAGTERFGLVDPG